MLDTQCSQFGFSTSSMASSIARRTCLQKILASLFSTIFKIYVHIAYKSKVRDDKAEHSNYLGDCDKYFPSFAKCFICQLFIARFSGDLTAFNK